MRQRINFDFRTRRGRQLFYQSAMWRKFRQAELGMFPWCAKCWPRIKPAVDLHHKKPLVRCAAAGAVRALELALDPENVEGLCKSCHASETLKEQAA